MLFSPEPKRDRKELFDREKELEQLKSLSSPISLVLGLRRTGKSSLIKVALSELKLTYIYIDLRKYEESIYISYKDIIQDLQKEINLLTHKFPKLIDFLKSIKGVSIAGNNVEFNWGGKDKISLSSLLQTLDEWTDNKVILVLDEAQELIKLRGINILPTLSYSFDNLRYIKIILSGSKMGMMYKFLKLKDSGSPLYGRALNEVILMPFKRDEAVNFLRRGFEELGIEFRREEEVYNILGGIPGWLTYFGYKYSITREFEKSINETLTYANNLIKKEFENFLQDKQIAKNRYLNIMRLLATDCASWSEIKRYLEIKEGKNISDSEIKRYLDNLNDSSFIVKSEERYCVSDPLMKFAFKT